MSILKAAGSALVAGGILLGASSFLVTRKPLGEALNLENSYQGFQLERGLYEMSFNIRDISHMTQETLDSYKTTTSAYEDAKSSGDFRAARAQLDLYEEIERSYDGFKLATFLTSFIGTLLIASKYALEYEFLESTS